MVISSMLIMLFVAPPSVDYENARAELDAAADALVEQSPAESVARLEAALADALTHPRELWDDPDAADKLARARVALVWAELASGDTQAALATMDLAIRSAGAAPLPLAGLGPDIHELHDQRRAALEAAGHASIAVNCEACELLIDEARSDNPRHELLLGTHRVWLFDPSGQLQPHFEDVSLETANETRTLDYRPAPVSAPVASPISSPRAESTKPPKPRGSPSPSLARPERPDRPNHAPSKLPRWAKIVGISVGAGLLVTGGVLLAIDGSCQGGGTPTVENVPTCAKIWNHSASSYALLGVGGGLLVGATVWLAVDEARAGRRRTSAVVGWTMRF